MVKIFMPMSFAFWAASVTPASWFSPSVISTSTLWLSSSFSNVRNASLTASLMAVPPCGMMSVVRELTFCTKALRSIVSGHCRNAVPEKAIRPRRSRLARRIRSSTASLARSSRFGVWSVASILREVSTATRMSRLRVSVFCSS